MADISEARAALRRDIVRTKVRGHLKTNNSKSTR